MTPVGVVLMSIAVLSAMMACLIAGLLLVEARVVRRGRCRVTINDQAEPLPVAAGQPLLTALSGHRVFLPAACGGQGTCGLCKCRVDQGGGEILLTETGLLTRREQRQGYRLSCQVKVREDLRLRLPAEIFRARKFTATVRSNENVATFIKELILELADPLDFQPGGYIQIYIPPYQLSFQDFHVGERFRPEWDRAGLRALWAENEEEVFRAYSMANHPGEPGIVRLNVRIALPPQGDLPPGKASAYLFALRPGDRIEISGPYGEFFIKETDREMVYVGGGAGMAPLRSHLKHLFRADAATARRVSFWYGARSRQEIFYEEEMRSLAERHANFSFQVALSAPRPEDRWDGPTGMIHQVLYEQYLRDHPEPEEAEYYLCGPPPMIAAVQQLLDSLGVPPEMIAFDAFG